MPFRSNVDQWLSVDAFLERGIFGAEVGKSLSDETKKSAMLAGWASYHWQWGKKMGNHRQHLGLFFCFRTWKFTPVLKFASSPFRKKKPVVMAWLILLFTSLNWDLIHPLLIPQGYHWIISWERSVPASALNLAKSLLRLLERSESATRQTASDKPLPWRYIVGSLGVLSQRHVINAYFYVNIRSAGVCVILASRESFQSIFKTFDCL